MPCNNTSMMLPLTMDGHHHVGGGGGGGGVISPIIQPQNKPMLNGNSAAAAAAAVTAALNAAANNNLNSLSNNAIANAQANVNAAAAANQNQSSRYKTELCRPFEEFNVCKYGDKCQFAHGPAELRKMPRHPKYKTELCRTFHTMGLCPYGHRCHFIHNSDEINIAAGGNNGGNSNGGNNQNQNAGQTSIIGQGVTAPKDLITHRSSMSSSSSTASSSSSTSGLGSGGSSPVYHPYLPSAGGLGNGPDSDLLAAAAASGLTFGQLAAAAQVQAQLASAVLPPLSPSQSPSFCSSVPSLSSSPPLSATSNTSLNAASHFYTPINFYMENNHRLPVFWNLSP